MMHNFRWPFLFFLLILQLFECTNLAGASEVFQENAQPEASLLPKPVDMRIRDIAVIKCPQFSSLHEMSFDDLVEAYELHYVPEGDCSTQITVNAVILLVAGNFYTGTVYPKSVLTVTERVRFPRANGHILYQMQHDLRIVQFLGFDGCVELFKLLMERIQNRMAQTSTDSDRLRYLNRAVDGLQDFLKFFLNEPSVFRPKPECKHAQREQEYEYFKKIFTEISPERIERVGSVKYFPLAIERFKEVVTEGDLFFFYEGFRRNAENMTYASLRSKVNFLVKISNFSAEVDAEAMSKRFSVINEQLLPLNYEFNNSILKARAFAVVYAQMCPVLRAFMLLDSTDAVRIYLNVYKTTCLTEGLTTKMTEVVLPVLDRMIAATDFVNKAKHSAQAAKEVFEVVLKVFGWSQRSFLESAIKYNLIWLTEVALIFMNQVDQPTAFSLVTMAISKLERPRHVELIILVIAYFPCLNAKELLTMADLIQIPKSPPLKNRRLTFEYNLNCLGRTLLKQSARILKLIETSRGICSEFIPLPCPLEILDSLFPKLYEYKVDRPPKQEYMLYPHNSQYNLAQLILFRVSGISFASSRLYNDNNDIPEWREVIGFLNFMTQREASLRAFNGEVPLFFDPIEGGLKLLDVDAEEYSRKYRDTAEAFFFAERKS